MKKNIFSITNTCKKKVCIATMCSVFIATSAMMSSTIFADSKTVVSVTNTAIDFQKAIEIALEKTNGGIVIGSELDYEYGKYVYEIEIVKENQKFFMDIAVDNAEVFNFRQIDFNTQNANNKPVITITDKEITAKKAQEIALLKSNGGTITKCELDYENGIKIYEIEVINANTEYSMDIGAADSVIYDYEEETVSVPHIPTKPITPIPSTEYKPPTATPKAKPTATMQITADAARNIALAKAGSGTVVSLYPDYDDGRKVYEVTIIDGNTKYEMEIDATDSRVKDFEKETVRETVRPKDKIDRHDDDRYDNDRDDHDDDDDRYDHDDDDDRYDD